MGKVVGLLLELNQPSMAVPAAFPLKDMLFVSPDQDSGPGQVVASTHTTQRDKKGHKKGST